MGFKMAASFPIPSIPSRLGRVIMVCWFLPNYKTNRVGACSDVAHLSLSSSLGFPIRVATYISTSIVLTTIRLYQSSNGSDSALLLLLTQQIGCDWVMLIYCPASTQ